MICCASAVPDDLQWIRIKKAQTNHSDMQAAVDHREWQFGKGQMNDLSSYELLMIRSPFEPAVHKMEVLHYLSKIWKV
ncbi:hypothetical protein EJB05_29832, partial [Eragrostis curvula]